MTGLSFRPAVPGDTPILRALWERSVQATHGFVAPSDLAEISVKVRAVYLPNAALTVAERNGDILGFMGMTGRRIDALFLDPCAFGAGVGRAFIEHARATGNPLSVEVNEANAPARAFYEHMGFVMTARSETDDEGRPYPILTMREADGQMG